MLLLISNNLSSSQSAPWSVQGEFVFILAIFVGYLLTLIDELAQLIIGMSRKKGWLYNTYKIPSLSFNIVEKTLHIIISAENIEKTFFSEFKLERISFILEV